jgi:hypothetical protein
LLYQQLLGLARQHRLVFFAGLPGTGKSLLTHQLTHLAVTAGRTVHLLQWDMARPVFEMHPYGQRYPLVDGVTHGVIRLAVGRWARQALVQWQARYPEARHLLLGETPFIGHRFMELARPYQDAAEALLRNTSVFVLPVPSAEVRQFIATERQRRSLQPLHRQETEDAPPHVLQALWQELYRIAPALGLALPAETTAPPYDPLLYQRVYAHLLRYRQVMLCPIKTLLPTAAMSVYTYTVERHLLTPTPEEVEHYIQDVEQAYPEAAALQRVLNQWYVIPS